MSKGSGGTRTQSSNNGGQALKSPNGYTGGKFYDFFQGKGVPYSEMPKKAAQEVEYALIKAAQDRNVPKENIPKLESIVKNYTSDVIKDSENKSQALRTFESVYSDLSSSSDDSFKRGLAKINSGYIADSGDTIEMKKILQKKWK